MSQNGFNKERFAALLKKAMGKRNMSQYALHSGVSLTYISKLIRQLVNNPPQPETIRKLANKAHAGVSYAELLAAAGHIGDKTILHTGSTDNDLSSLINKSEYYNGFPLSEDDRNRIRTVLDIVFHYAKVN